jgi:hypothetical protein
VASAFDYDANAKRNSPYPCFYLGRSRIISREGNALACCMVFPEDQGDLALGNIKEAPITALYSADKLSNLHRLNMNGQLGHIRPCNTCDAYRNVPNIWFRNPLHRFGIGRMWY